MSIEDAFRRAVDLEGLPEIAFQRLCPLLTGGNIEVRATRRKAVWPSDTSKTNDFKLNASVWPSILLRLEHGEFVVEEAEDTDLIIGPGFDPFTLSQWQIAVSIETFDRAFSVHEAIPLAVAPQMVLATKQSGGRPHTHDWAGAAAEAATYVVENDFPSLETTLVEVLKQWFAKRKRTPDRRSIEKFVTAMYACRPTKP